MIAKRLARPTWKIADYMGSAGVQLDKAKVQRVIDLSGLSADVDEISSDLAHQLQFLQVLLTADTQNAKPLARFIAPQVCPPAGEGLGEGLGEGGAAAAAAEPQTWDPTSIAAQSKNGFYTVHKSTGSDSDHQA